MSEKDAALKILGLKPSAIKVINVFGKRLEAAKNYNDSIQNIGSTGDALQHELQIANIASQIYEAWTTLCCERMKYFICNECCRLTKIEHIHCPECKCILQIKRTWPEADVGVERITCQKCEFKNIRIIDLPDEVALLRSESMDRSKY